MAGGTGGFSGDGGPAIAAALNYPTKIASDSAGNLYIADSRNYRIRMVTVAGNISTVAGSTQYGFGGDGGSASNALLYHPQGVAVYANNLYIADFDNNRIRKISSDGTISTVAGNGTGGFSGDGGPATAAQLNGPTGVAIDSSGNFYIADSNNCRIRKVTKTAGTISTIAGNGIEGFSGDGGPATAAQIPYLRGVAVFGNNVYFADADNNRIRMVSGAGTINTVAGNGTAGFGGDGGPATAAALLYPMKVAVDSAGNLFVADTYNFRIREVTTSGIINTVAGNGLPNGFSGDGGPATAAQLNYPTDVFVDSVGNLYISDSENYRIRVVTTSGIISTVAGNGTAGFSGDGGPATAAQINSPMAIAVDFYRNNDSYTITPAAQFYDDDGNHLKIYIADSEDNRIRVVSFVPPTVETTAVASITTATAIAGGNVTADRGAPVTDRGICLWVKATTYVMGWPCISDGGSGLGQFTVPLTGLNENGYYEVQSYATNFIGTRLGSFLQFQTLALPTVSTSPPSSVTQSTASSGGNVIYANGTVTARGVCWSTSANPTTSDSCTSNGSGTGSFASTITGLTTSTTYHLRAYATSSAGTAYGTDNAFTTMAPPDFQVSIANGGSFSATVAAGSNALYNLAITGTNNFSGSVTFGCSGLPSGAKCSVSPAPLSISGSAAVPLTVTISTAAAPKTSAIKHKAGAAFPWCAPAASAGAVSLCCATLLFSMRKRRRLSMAFILLSAIGLVACGGSKKASNGGTPQGTYSVVFTATSGSASHTYALTLTVIK
jgi:hypothetical protein